MNIDTSVLNNVNAQSGNAQMNNSQSDELRESFLTMLITQLQNQDPMDPMKNKDMTAQLAQINTVSGIEQLNDTLNGITQQVDASQMIEASGLIGNAVLVPGSNVKVSTGENEEGDAQTTTTPFGIELENPASRVEVTLTNQSGEVVATREIENVKAGVESFSWDGQAKGGEAVPDGAYNVSLKAFNADGEEMPSTALNYALVQGVTPATANEDVRLDLGGVYGQVAMNDIKQIL
ncbi:flagellar hook assembly protein FlgD [Vreelandella subglaciescola]|jgi:flagellar basal-body rod modification protein FlgD|uniref:Basal-body rod modification protein FlgD n=1 Tax=Vreelandella subglaciescola TaxID=29571 RepID=A0A1M7HEQ3_9GAMM|nr:flagellar hook assembly protein FlgD [Halomonas subglaciescola]SHM26924.1 flagellar basal-body rod modification protein FlgD [Halomonas subglaciescola]